MAFFKKKKPTNAGNGLNRAARVVADYKLITSVFKEHPHISIKEVFGAPPERYHFQYRIDGLEKAANAIEVKAEHIVEVLLPPAYPEVAPVCTRITPLFHPNISDSAIDVSKFWRPGSPLADLIVVIGEMICLQKYDTQNPLSGEAAKWADRNRSMLPLCKDDLRYVQPPVAPVDPPATTVAVLEQNAEKTPPPEDARKTEGIYIDSGVDQISIDGETVSTPPRELETRKTAVLQEESISDDTVSNATDTAKPNPAQAVSQTPDVAKSESQVQEPLKSEIPRDNGAAEAKPVETEPQISNSAKSELRTFAQIQKKPSEYISASKPETSKEVPANANEDAQSGLTEASVPSSQKETETAMPVVSRDRARNGRAIDAEETSQEETISCGTCSCFNPISANFCSNCGAKIKRQSLRSDVSLSKVMLLSALTSIPVAILSVAITLLIVNQIKPAVRIVEVPAPAVQAAAVVPTSVPPPLTAVQEVPQSKPKPDIASDAAPKAPRSSALSADQKRERIEECLKLAQTYVNLGSFDEAINKYMYVLKLDPKNDDALDGLRTVRDAKDRAAVDSEKIKK